MTKTNMNSISGRLVAAGLLFLVSAPAALAADSEGRYAIEGVGIATCSQFLEALEKNSSQKFLFAGWLNGYQSALNEKTPGVFDLSPWQDVNTLTDYLVMHCAKQPKQFFGQAVAAMMTALRGQAATAYATPIELDRPQGGKMIIYPEIVRRAQSELKTLGLYKAPVSGKYDEATRSGVRSFQKSKKLPVTGLPDQKTLHLLLVDGPGRRGAAKKK